jgi:hypothetical protein
VKNNAFTLFKGIKAISGNKKITIQYLTIKTTNSFGMYNPGNQLKKQGKICTAAVGTALSSPGMKNPR